MKRAIPERSSWKRSGFEWRDLVGAYLDAASAAVARAALKGNSTGQEQIADFDRVYNAAVEQLRGGIAGLREYFASAYLLSPEELVALRCKLGDKILSGKFPQQDALRIIAIVLAALEDGTAGGTDGAAA
jgi:hypothetical protein